MRLRKKANIFFLLLLHCHTCYGNDEAFVRSFVHHYDFNTEGRYTHEYHPYLLQKTQKSLTKLEDRLTLEGMHLHGRMLIGGYEENAIPSYYTDYRESKINDEASSENKAGWSLRLHNRFGLMTGFLFKDFNTKASRWYRDQSPPIEHINPDHVELFVDEGGIFQEHAFGEALNHMDLYKHRLEQCFKQEKTKDILGELIHFWEGMYEHEVKAGGRRVSATQDVLFSVEYARYLNNCELPILKYYLGPDITYPIETFIGQTREATENSQEFVKQFARKLEPVADKNTAYVFCSFVDGVGKSTMLGNVKNWQVHGDAIEDYERVDNSSSQYATIFPFKEKVFIADLPAQVSHFTYKPDGLVYVHAHAELSIDALTKVRNFVQEHKETYIDGYRDLYLSVKDTVDQEGYFASSLNDPNDVGRAFMRNIILLKRELANTWVPFTFEEQHYLFNFAEPSEVRMLCPLSRAPSCGLKNIESEQMLFFDGIRFPLKYQKFLDNFVTLLKGQKIEEVVFVDFISMYPRSSRENIRINYLLQQMALLNAEFSMQESLYKNFVSPAELYSDLLRKDTSKQIYDAFNSETEIRLILHQLLVGRDEHYQHGISIETLTTILRKELRPDRDNSHITKCTRDKFYQEQNHLKETFGLTKELENLQQFSFIHAAIFSDELYNMLQEVVVNDSFCRLWEDLNGAVDFQDELYLGKLDRLMKLEEGGEVLTRYEFTPECKNPVYLASFLRTIRANWYATLANLLYAQPAGGGKLQLVGPRYNVPPTLLKPGLNGQVYLVQKSMPDAQGDMRDEMPKKPKEFHLSGDPEWGEFEDKYYPLDWDNDGTNYGIFAFDCNLAQKKRGTKKHSLVSLLVHEYQREHGADSVMPTSRLYNNLIQMPKWHSERQQMHTQAQRNGFFPLERMPVQQRGDIYLGREDQRLGAQIATIMLATLEMVAKDLNGDVVVRKGHRKDFKAALHLIEEVVLPKYFGIFFEAPLFEDYDSVDPALTWEELEE